MKEITIGTNEAGQRMDKLVKKVLNQAPDSFIYKMLRKKNIKLNGLKACGSEMLVCGDQIQIYLADDTYNKFHQPTCTTDFSNKKKSRFPNVDVLYQDKNVIIFNKPVGMLSQKSQAEDISLNEYLIQYAIEENIITKAQLATFHPSVCNRLDRNTSGIVLAGISLQGSQLLSALLKSRELNKYYLAIVKGRVTRDSYVEAYLRKSEINNSVQLSDKPAKDATLIKTEYSPICTNDTYSFLRIKLITGKTHQIRAHLAYIGHPIIGDVKYGDVETNKLWKKKAGLTNQLLHAYEVQFPELEAPFTYLSKQNIIAPLPQQFKRIEDIIWPHGIHAD